MSSPSERTPRFIDPTAESDLFTYAHIATSTPNHVNGADAFAVFPGMGEHARINTVLQDWNNRQESTRFLLVAGTNGGEKTQLQPSLKMLSTEYGLVESEDVHTQVSAEHTLEQTEWLVGTARKLGAKSISLYVTPWHMPRAYGTVVKKILDDANSGKDLIPVFPRVVPISPTSIIPETGKSVVEMSPGEAVRIKKYQAKGDVATLEELKYYVDWLWKQDIEPI